MTNLSDKHVLRNQQAFDERYVDDAAELVWQGRKIVLLAELIADLPEKNVVADVGCGSGFAAPDYFRAGVKELHGFDISSTGLASAKARGMIADYWNFEGEPCPREDDTFDVVIAGDVIEHLLDTEHFLRELDRILKPGGYLLLTTPNLASWYNRMRLLRGKVPTGYPGVSSDFRADINVDNNHLRVNLASEWSALFEAQGLKVERMLGWSHLQAWRGTLRSDVIRLLGRLAERRPTLAENLVFVLSKVK